MPDLKKPSFYNVKYMLEKAKNIKINHINEKKMNKLK